MQYPSEEKIIQFNLFALELIKAKKADKAAVLSYTKIKEALILCQEKEGDLYDKAAILLKGLVQKHPFASGNRRTALIATKYFVTLNKGKFSIKDDPAQARAMQGVRENFYSNEELKEWIKNGKIREFKR